MKPSFVASTSRHGYRRNMIGKPIQMKKIHTFQNSELFNQRTDDTNSIRIF